VDDDCDGEVDELCGVDGVSACAILAEEFQDPASIIATREQLRMSVFITYDECEILSDQLSEQRERRLELEKMCRTEL
jgi:hypothetical protein